MTLLTVDQQSNLLNAFSQLDGYDSIVADKVVRTPYKLGAQRRVIVKNLNALKASLEVWKETANAIFKESFPSLELGQTAKEEEFPEEFPKYRIAIQEAATKKDEFDLLPLTEKAVYEDNEMPVAALAVLDEHGLIAA